MSDFEKASNRVNLGPRDAETVVNQLIKAKNSAENRRIECHQLIKTLAGIYNNFIKLKDVEDSSLDKIKLAKQQKLKRFAKLTGNQYVKIVKRYEKLVPEYENMEKKYIEYGDHIFNTMLVLGNSELEELYFGSELKSSNPDLIADKMIEAMNVADFELEDIITELVLEQSENDQKVIELLKKFEYYNYQFAILEGYLKTLANFFVEL
ncbi:MAG: hypothetical protein OHK0017_06220 [Patescibacteria group bacterium]